MRYFLEVSYKGSKYAGFQVQKNANTVQAEVEKVLEVILKKKVELTGSSRTDAGVHALQNFFHFDIDAEFDASSIYNLNALLPLDIVIKSVTQVADDAHSRFDATSRSYRYFISTAKDPFTADTAWYYPYTVDVDILNQAAQLLLRHTDFTSFSKRNTQVHTKECTLLKSEWRCEGQGLMYSVEANRFLRGMARGLIGTMLLAGRGRISLAEFEDIILAKDCTKSNFATPAHGLFLVQVTYPADVWKKGAK